MYTYQIEILIRENIMQNKSGKPCCGHGGVRPGCGRKPGVKTRPVRIPEWLIEELEKISDPRECIVNACVEQFGIKDRRLKTGEHD